MIATAPAWFSRYIDLVPDETLIDALAQNGMPVLQAIVPELRQLGDTVYAPGKWTVKDMLQHITDTERIFAYRALRIMRGDATPLPGFDEEQYALHTNVRSLTLDELLAEFDLVRQSGILLFKYATPGMLQRVGTCNGQTMSGVGIGYTMAGHLLHHINVLRERYFPLL